MPLNLDSCIAGVFTPGNIGASSGLPPVEPIVPSLAGAAPAVFETLSASDTLIFFTGELLHEAAHTSDSYVATGGAYVVTIAEAAAAVDAVYLAQVFDVLLADVVEATDAPSVHEPAIVDADLTEAVTAASAQDGAVSTLAAVTESSTSASTQDATVSGAATVTWDPATVTAVTLSGGDLVTTSTGTTAVNQGARVATASGKTAGKFYFEVTLTTIATLVGQGANRGIGVGTTASTYTTMGNGGATGCHMYLSGNIWSNNANTSISILTRSQGDVVGVAVDLSNRKIWYRAAPSGNWNNSGTANPATNTLGVTVPAGTMVPFVTFGGTGGVTGQVFTANFGAAAFTGSVPSGFTAGWPV